VNFATTHKQTILSKWKKNHGTILWLSTNAYHLGDNQLNICKTFNLDVQYPHAIDTSMTIHMQGGQNTLSKKKKKKKKKKGVY
jgi:hypothetical protein